MGDLVEWQLRTADLERMLNAAIDERDAARANHLKVMKERDEALGKIAEAAKLAAPRWPRDPQDVTICAEPCGDPTCRFAAEVRKALGVCAICGPQMRLADSPCTHLGSPGA